MFGSPRAVAAAVVSEGVGRREWFGQPRRRSMVFSDLGCGLEVVVPMMSILKDKPR